MPSLHPEAVLELMRLSTTVPAEVALRGVLDKIFQEDMPEDGGDLPRVTIRMLVDAGQIGAVLGKGGSIIADMRRNTNAQIKVLQGNELPACALETDEIVQVFGEYDKAVAAVNIIAQKLKGAPQRRRNVPQMGAPHNPALGQQHFMSPSPSGVSAFGVGVSPGVSNVLQLPGVGPQLLGGAGLVEATFRLLVPEKLTGSIIGKGGEVIRRIREETGAKVIIYNTVERCDERVLKCVSMDDTTAQVCAAQEAMIRALFCLFKNEENNPGAVLSIRMLIPSDQIGAIMGKKGTIIKGIRRDTGAILVVQPRDQLPACSHEGDELFEIKGKMDSVISAFQTVCSLLRTNMGRTQAKAAAEAGGGDPNIPAGAFGSGGFGGVSQGPLTVIADNPVMLTAAGAPGVALQAGGFGVGVPGPQNLINQYAQAGGLIQQMQQPQLAGAIDPSVLGLMPNLNMAGAGQVSVRLLLTQLQANAVTGQGGTNLRQIREISGAFVKLHNPQANGDRELELVGTHEQTQAAQNLVNTFLLVASLPTQVRVVVNADGTVMQGQPTVGTGLSTGGLTGGAQFIMKQE
ncbi:unnamed protein product [Ostreobium quekettii]|uniref:K Homology domain-containing protein n=1 Tax=Ostreobium quekettii TaxID=121088 RepID=A0A8S1IPM2_9CHLO|nr:unnamed protein product [Ostreobium quekettii]